MTNYAGVNALTAGQLDPFGGTGAGLATSTSATNETMQLGNCYNYPTQTAGDWFIGGAWVHGTVGGQTNYTGILVNSCSTALPTWATTQGAQTTMRGMGKGDGENQFQWFAYKVGASGSAADKVGIVAQFSSTFPATVFGPVLFYIPSGTLSDNEVLELAASMNSIDSSCVVGSFCNVAGHPIQADQFNTTSSFQVGGHVLISKTAPVIASGFNSSGYSVSAQNGTASFLVTVGTGSATSAGVLTLPTATNGWTCSATNRSRADQIQQTADSQTSATFTNYGTSFSATNFTNGDVIQFSCAAY